MEPHAVGPDRVIHVGPTIANVILHENRRESLGFWTIVRIPEVKCAGPDSGKLVQARFVADRPAQKFERSSDFGLAFFGARELPEEFAFLARGLLYRPFTEFRRIKESNKARFLPVIGDYENRAKAALDELFEFYDAGQVPPQLFEAEPEGDLLPLRENDRASHRISW